MLPEALVELAFRMTTSDLRLVFATPAKGATGLRSTSGLDVSARRVSRRRAHQQDDDQPPNVRDFGV